MWGGDYVAMKSENTQNKEQPAYYAIIPAHVRYDKELPDKAKLLYGEITALCTKEGYCWATNSYFADLYGVRKETISRFISKLESCGYISTKLIYKLGRKEIEQRRIYIPTKTAIDEDINSPIDENINTPIDENINSPIDENVNSPIDENINSPIDENVKDRSFISNTSMNITSMNIKDIPSPSVRMPAEQPNQPPLADESQQAFANTNFTDPICKEADNKLNPPPHQQDEHLTVEMAKGAGHPPVYHAMTLVEEWFEQFWTAYPKKGKKKGGKEDTRKTWLKVCADKEQNEALFLMIMQRLKAKKKWWDDNQTEERHMPYATTWLQNEFPSARTAIEQLFDRFWSVYPRKVGKREAEDAWKKIGPDEALFHVIVQSLDRAKHWWSINRTETKHIPHASTWLNGQRWNDEMPLTQAVQGQQMPMSERKEIGGKLNASTGRNYQIGGEDDPYRSLMQ